VDAERQRFREKQRETGNTRDCARERDSETAREHGTDERDTVREVSVSTDTEQQRPVVMHQ